MVTEFTFHPTRALAMRATISTVRRLAVLPWWTWCYILAASSGIALLANILHALAHEKVPLWRWILSPLCGPIVGLISFAGIYLQLRFCGSVTVRKEGLFLGGWRRVLGFWRPVECQVETRGPGLHLVTILCTTPFSKMPGCKKSKGVIYFGLTHNLAHAEAFASAFREKYPPA